MWRNPYAWPSREMRDLGTPTSIDYEPVPTVTPALDPAKVGGRGDCEVYDVDLLDDEDADEESESLDLDVYGAVIFSVIHDSIELMSGHDNDKLDWGLNFMRVLFVTVSLIFNYLLQGTLLMFSYWTVVLPAVRNAQYLYKDYHANCFDADGQYNADKCSEWPQEDHDNLCRLVASSFWFLYLMLTLWWMTMLTEFRRTDRVWRHFAGLPSTHNFEAMIIRRPDGSKVVKRMVPEIKWFLFILTILPKYAVSIGLMVIGTWWLVATDGLEDLILNALALSFIVDIDEIIFNSLFPVSFAEEMAQVKLWKGEGKSLEEKKQAMLSGYSRSTMYAFVILFGAYLYLAKLQGSPFIGVLPGYHNDAKCESFWMKQDELVCDTWAVWHGATCFPFGVADAEELPPHPEVYN